MSMTHKQPELPGKNTSRYEAMRDARAILAMMGMPQVVPASKGKNKSQKPNYKKKKAHAKVKRQMAKRSRQINRRLA